MICMTFDEALSAFEKEISYFEKIDKSYLLDSSEFIYTFEKYLSEVTKKHQEKYKSLKEKYTKEQLAILEENSDFTDLFFQTFEKQKRYKRKKAAVDLEIKEAVLLLLCNYIKSNIGKLLLYIMISKVSVNRTDTIKDVISFVKTNFDDIISLIKKPISKALMHGEHFKLRPTGNYAEAIKQLSEKIPSYGNNFEVLCKTEIQKYIYDHPEVEQKIILNLSGKHREIFIEYFGLTGHTAKNFEQIAFSKGKKTSTVVNDFIQGMKKFRNNLKF